MIKKRSRNKKLIFLFLLEVILFFVVHTNYVSSSIEESTQKNRPSYPTFSGGNTLNQQEYPLPNQFPALEEINLKKKDSVEPSEEIFSNGTEVRYRTFNIYRDSEEFVPKPLKGDELNEYFKSLNLKDENIYVMVQFEGFDGDPSLDQIEILEQDGVELFEYYRDHTYFARFSKEILETKSYDFIRWIGLPSLNFESKINPFVKKQVEESDSESLEISLKFYEFPNEEQLDTLTEFIREIKYSDNFSPVLLVEIEPSKILDLAKENFVRQINPKPKGELLLDRGSRIVAADYVWGSNTASGITVGSIDSGIEHNHNHFDQINVYDAYDYVDNDTNPEAFGNEHGTLVAGIISGEGSFNSRLLKGISYKANLVVQRTHNSSGDNVAPPSYQNTIWNNILDPDDDGNYFEPSSADLISISWGDTAGGSFGDYDDTSEKVDEVVLGYLGKEVLVVMAAGNSELSNRGVVPNAAAKNAITVGNSADCESSFETCSLFGPSYDPNNLYVVETSSRNTSDGRVKPDVLAPGYSITSSSLGNSYDAVGGTSYAAPHVAAIVAQVIKQYPSLSPAGIKALIVSNTVGGGTTDNINYDQGWGRIDAFRTLYKLDDDYIDSYNEATVGEFLSGFPSTICYNIGVPTGADRLVAVIAWSDVPGDASGGNTQTLYNDLDLWLKDETGAILSWTENDDDINNVEKYVINSPDQGTWQACVSEKSLVGPLGTGKQNFAISFQVNKQANTPVLQVDLFPGTLSLVGGQTTTIYAKVGVSEGFYAYDLNTTLQVPSGITITSGEFDGSDADKDRVGDVPINGVRNTRAWTIRGDTLGTKEISVHVSGKRIDGGTYTGSDSVFIDVVNETQATTGNVTLCEYPGYEFCIEYEEPDPMIHCEVSIAINLYENSNEIKWGGVNDASDPYVIHNYTIGWVDVDADKMYYDVNNPNSGGCNKDNCTGELLADEGTKAVVFAPAVASHEEILGWEKAAFGVDEACWVWFLPFQPNYGSSNPIYVLNCFEDSDCPIGDYCKKLGNWDNWKCFPQKTNGATCARDSECASGFCDNDNLGLEDDGWCFERHNSYFDSQEPLYCEVSTGLGIEQCDERQVGESYSACNTGGETYFADRCTNICGGEDADNVCRSSAFAFGCTADPLCNNVTAGTGNCNPDCTYNSQQPTNSTILRPNGGEVLYESTSINWSISHDPDNWFVRYFLQYSNDSGNNWYSIVSNYGHKNMFNDSLTSKELNFGGNENKTVYFRLPKDAEIKHVRLKLEGKEA